METFTLGTAIGLNTTHNASLYASVNSSCAQTPPPPSPATAGHFPALLVPGWGICKCCAAQGPGICQPRGQSRGIDMQAVSYQNITTQRISLGKKEDWLVCQGQEKIEEGCKGMFLILCMHFFIANQASITGRNRELST